jgi:hypothetical protein
MPQAVCPSCKVEHPGPRPGPELAHSLKLGLDAAAQRASPAEQVRLLMVNVELVHAELRGLCQICSYSTVAERVAAQRDFYSETRPRLQLVRGERA